MKNLFIVFPGGCGGNHLGNIISLNQKFTPLFQSQNYGVDLLKKYKNMANDPVDKNSKLGKRIVHGVKAHFSEVHHLDNLFVEQEFSKLLLNQTINILIGHEHQFDQAEREPGLISRVIDPYWIILNYPIENSIAYNRIKLYEFTPRPERYKKPFYTVEGSTTHAKAEIHNSMYIETEKFIDKNGCSYIKEKLQKINIELNDLAFEIHEIWYNKLISVLTYYDMMPTKYFNEYGDLN